MTRFLKCDQTTPRNHVFFAFTCMEIITSNRVGLKITAQHLQLILQKGYRLNPLKHDFANILVCLRKLNTNEMINYT